MLAGIRCLHTEGEPLFTHINEGDSVYFVHSYHFVCEKDYIAATTDYGCEVVVIGSK